MLDFTIGSSFIHVVIESRLFVKQDFQSWLRSRHTINKDDFLFDKKRILTAFSLQCQIDTKKNQNHKILRIQNFTLVVKITGGAFFPN